MPNLLRRILTFGTPAPAWEEVTAATLYKVLWSYYHSNDLYKNVQEGMFRLGVQSEDTLPLRNPAFRVVEFYVSKLWTRSGDIESPNEAILEPIGLVHKWSNWPNKKRLVARQFSALGDMFIKVGSKPDRVFFQIIDPAHVTDFSTDERGFLTYCRFDIPMTSVSNSGLTTSQLHTEVWTKDNVRVWMHHKTAADAVSKLGAPNTTMTTAEMGIDFIPIVHAKFRDVGNDRGQGAFTHALDKIDEANRMATRMHRQLFRYNSATWTLSANGADASGRPLPAPRLGSSAGGGLDDTLMIGDDRVFRLPGNSNLSALDAKIDFSASLSVLQDHMLELEKDLPELAYYSLRQMGEISGRAIQLLLSDAIDRVYEARASAEAAIIRANQMALTIGAALGIFGNLNGDYASGAFEHEFVEEDVISLSSVEIALAEKTEVEAKALKLTIGVSQEQVLRELGYSDEDAMQFAIEIAAQKETNQKALDAGQFA